MTYYLIDMRALCKFVRLKHVFITTTSVFAGLFVKIVLFKQCSYSPKKAK